MLLGNLLYFAAEEHLPAWARHEPFAIDLGLLLDFALCVGLFGLSYLFFPPKNDA